MGAVKPQMRWSLWWFIIGAAGMAGVAPGSPVVFSTGAKTNIPGLGQVQDEDLVRLDEGAFSLFRDDGNDFTVDLRSVALHEGSVLFTLNKATSLQGSAFEKYQVIGFTPDRPGDFAGPGRYWLFADIGAITGSSQVYDALFMYEGSLVFSPSSPATFAGLGSVQDEDLIMWTPTVPGEFVSGQGSLSMFKDLTGLTSIDLDGAEVLNGVLYFSMKSGGSIEGVSFNDEDILSFTPEVPGVFDGAGTFAMYQDMTSYLTKNVDAVGFAPESSTWPLLSIGLLAILYGMRPAPVVPTRSVEPNQAPTTRAER